MLSVRTGVPSRLFRVAFCVIRTIRSRFIKLNQAAIDLAQINPRGSLYSIGVKCITHRFYFRTTNYRRRTTWLTYLDDRNVRGDGGGGGEEEEDKESGYSEQIASFAFFLSCLRSIHRYRAILYTICIYIYIVEYYFESITFDVKYNTIRIKTCMETKYLSIKQGKKIKMFLCRI